MKVAGRTFVGVVVGALAAGAAVACSTTTTIPATGLEVIVTADGLSAPADLDDIRLQVSQQVDGGGWSPIWNRDYVVPSQEATLPATFGIASSGSGQEVLVTVTAFRGGPSGQPVVQRVAQVQLPSDRTAALWMVLDKLCEGQVTRVGAEGGPVSTCPSGESCQPGNGECGGNVVDLTMLPTYTPGQDLDAGSQLGLVLGDGGVPDAANTSDADATGAMSPDASDDASDADAADAPMEDVGLVVPPSCAPGGAGLTNCGPGGSGSESCCTSLPVPGGAYYRTYTNTGSGPMSEADPATISDFQLDKYLVTVGRFRQFVNAVFPADGGTGWLPPAGAGRHTYLNSGNGLVDSPAEAGTVYETGWQDADDGNIYPTDANLTSAACGTSYATWTSTPGAQENLPINCPNWYEAYAFCIWDGGFLPSEAEWEYAAAGGTQQREYPWGSTPPGGASQYAILACAYGPDYCTSTLANIAPVGTPTLGAGLWGQLDMAGELWEWVLDWYAPYGDPCTDCANLNTTSLRVALGGHFSDVPPAITSYNRGGGAVPVGRFNYIGFRCARAPAASGGG
jgi:formylglycine-generating enzyme required for sulfatase activity